MTVIERPLFGRVEIRRMRRNLITGPRGNAPTAWQATVGSGTSPAVTTATTAGMNVGGLGIDTFLRAQATTTGTWLDIRNTESHGVLVQTGGSVTASAWVRQSTISSCQGAAYIQFYDAAGVVLHTVSTPAPLPALPSGVWTRIHVSGVVPAGTVRVRAIFRALGSVVSGSRLDATGFLVEHAAKLGSWYETTAPGDGELAHATNLTIRRGGSRTGLGLKTDVGLATFQLLNAEDPMRGGTFQPGQEVRAVSRNLAGQLVELFSGRVVDVASSYPLNKSNGRQRAVTTVTVADAVKTHGETPRYGVSIPTGFETFEARISRLAGSALAPIEAPAQGAPREVYAF
ncbi:minor tail protein [Microbacterium phage Belthelas]|nr:minor tail protein [Microbacterium phage Belthelas]